MKRNMGSADIVIRAVVALVVLVLYFMHFIAGALAIILLIVAGIFLLTSFFGVCPLYKLFGIDTSKKG